MTITLPDEPTGMRKLSPDHRGPGLRMRFARVPGATAKGVLTRPLRLPVVLGDFDVDEDFLHNDYDTVGAGQFSAASAGGKDAPQLRTMQIDTLTIDWHEYARWLTNPDVGPEVVRRELTRLARSKTPCELLAIVRGDEELRMKVTIRQLTRTLRAREADTRYWTIGISQWRDNSVTRRGGGNPNLPTTHALLRDTTWYGLARKYYPASVPISVGWRHIANANGMAHWGAKTPLVDSKRFRVGDKVKIPIEPIVATTGDPPRGVKGG